MAKNVRFGEYLQAVTVDTASVAYDKLLPKPQFDAHGREIPQKVTKLNMSGADIVRASLSIVNATPPPAPRGKVHYRLPYNCYSFLTRNPLGVDWIHSSNKTNDRGRQ